MKASKTAIEALSDMEAVSSLGDVRRIVGNSLLALVRKEISATDVVALSKGVDAISNSLSAEISLARVRLDLRERGAAVGEQVEFGKTLIGPGGPD